MATNPQKSTLSGEVSRADSILDKLKRRAEQVGYGSLICEIQVHQGQIRQVEITAIKERMRADYD